MRIGSAAAHTGGNSAGAGGDQIATLRPDVMVLDIQMPDLHGVSAADISWTRQAGIPVA
ncbi:MAG: hypothetical protein M3302_07500 [Actinomycetota bacterium]|nr:hypothetical protein [Actinomycetota bacterium]